MESSDQIQDTLPSDLIVDGLIKFFQGFFRTFPIFTWDEDDTQTGLQITDFESFNLPSVDFKPRLAVELVEGHWDNVAVNAMGSRSLRRQTETLTDLFKATATIHCISSVSVEARRLADIVFEAVRIFRTEIRKEMGFFNIDSLHRGREQRLVTSSIPIVRVVPVEIVIHVQRTNVKILDEQVFQATAP